MARRSNCARCSSSSRKKPDKPTMADRIIKILTPGTNFDLMTLDEAKMLAGMSLTDTTDDTQMQMFIDINSATVMVMCNRIFAREEVREEWRELNGGNRIFPSHWPIKDDDIESVESPIGTVLDPSAYELEEASGKIEIFGGAWIEPVAVTYWGGYELPDEAPLPLKRAVAMLNLQSKLLASLGTMAGIRMLSHKEARVMFYDPVKLMETALGSGAGANPLQSSIMQLLSHYIHFEV
jgi:hypothetical protein